MGLACHAPTKSVFYDMGKEHMPIEKREITSREEWLNGASRTSPRPASVRCSTAIPIKPRSNSILKSAEPNSCRRQQGHATWTPDGTGGRKGGRGNASRMETRPGPEYLRDPEFRLGATPDFVYVRNRPEYANPRSRAFRRAADQDRSAVGLRPRWNNGIEVPLYGSSCRPPPKRCSPMPTSS